MQRLGRLLLPSPSPPPRAVLPGRDAHGLVELVLVDVRREVVDVVKAADDVENDARVKLPLVPLCRRDDT